MNEEKLSAENVEIADHLIRLTHNQRNRGFCLFFLYLRNVKAKHTTILPPEFFPHFGNSLGYSQFNGLSFGSL